MKFEIGKYYQSISGRVIHILGEIHTFFHGSCFLAEEDTGNLTPIGRDKTAAVGWRQVSGWSRETYAINNIPEPTKPRLASGESESNNPI